MRRRILDVGLVVAALSLGGRVAGAEPRPAAGPCPVSDEAPCAITLEGPGAPSASASCASEHWSRLVRFTQPDRWSDSNGDGSWETVLEIRLDPSKECGCARMKIFYGDRISDWTAHIGNSPTNNGHGGDQGTTSSTAEVQLVDEKLTVYTAAQSVRRQVDKILEADIPPLAGRIVALEACDQSLGIEIRPVGRETLPQKWKLETLTSKLLFSLGPGKEEAIYAAFNRVVHLTTGAASHARVGSGVRRVEISLIP